MFFSRDVCLEFGSVTPTKYTKAPIAKEMTSGTQSEPFQAGCSTSIVFQINPTARVATGNVIRLWGVRKTPFPPSLSSDIRRDSPGTFVGETTGAAIFANRRQF